MRNSHTPLQAPPARPSRLSAPLLETPFTKVALLLMCAVLSFRPSLADVYTTWATAQGTNHPNQFTNPANAYNAADGVYATSSSNQGQTYAGYSGGGTAGRIDSVILMTYIYVTQARGNDYTRMTPEIGGTGVTTVTITTAMWNNHIGLANAGYENFDITGARAWTFSDLGSGLELYARDYKLGGADPGTLNFNSFGFRIVYTPTKPMLSIDTACQFSINGTGRVKFQYDLTDLNLDLCKLLIEHSFDGSTWQQSYIDSASTGAISNAGVSTGSSTGQISSIATNVSNQLLVWDSRNSGNQGGAFSGEDNLVYLRATPHDGGQIGDTKTPSAFNLDNQAPIGHGCYTPTNGSTWPGPTPTLTSSSATDMHPVFYSFQIDSNSTFATGALQSSGWNSGPTWVTFALIYGQRYYWRVKTKDDRGNESSYGAQFDFTVSGWAPNFVLDSARQTSTNGDGEVTVYYNLSDPQNDLCRLKIEYSYDFSAWYQAYIKSASAGTLDNTGVSTGASTGQITGLSTPISIQTFVWDTRSASNQHGAFGGEDASVYVRIIADDGAYSGEYLVSSAFTVDNQAPSSYACSSPSDGATGVSVTTSLLASPGSDLSTISYSFQIATNSAFTSNLQQRSWQTGLGWTPATLNGATTYYWRVRAKDSYGDSAGYAATSSFTTASGWSYPASGNIGPCSAPALGDGVVYVGTQGTYDSLLCIDVSTHARKWAFRADGSINSVSCQYDESQGKYAVYFSTSNSSVYALWDNGTGYSNKWPTNPISLGNKTIGEPMVDPDGTYLYLSYNGAGYKLSAANGSTVWSKTGINASTAAPVVDNGFVYFGNTNGIVYRYSLDGTAQAASADLGGSITAPFGQWAGTLYVTPAASSSIYALNPSTMGTKWSSNQGATCGPVYCWTTTGANKLYVGVGSSLKRLSDVGTGTTTDWTSTATAAAVQSLPVSVTGGSRIFFGCNTNRAYGLDSLGTTLTGWPQTVATGHTLNGAPAVDEANGMVIFGSSNGTIGIIYGYTLQ